jgi:arabinan endo-1,5-alpha-L-arabinosidase
MTRWLLFATAAILLFAAPGVCAAPALEVDIHDPAMAKQAGSYTLYSTGPGIPFYRSKDRVHWSEGGRVFATEPAWARAITPRFNGHLWAPDVAAYDGKYYLYYSVSGFGRNDSAIGVTVNKTLDPAAPDYKWEDKGLVVRSIAGRDDWNAIDPNVIVDEHGAPWMTFGSFWSGIKLVRLDADGTGLAEPQEWHSIARRDVAVSPDNASPGPGEIEGPFLFHKNGSYYLFVSTGLCCRGKNSTYRIMVGRAKDIAGPYLDRDGRDMMKAGGTPLIAENKALAGWGGQGVYNFDGTDFVVMHAYEAADNNFHRLKIVEIKWDAAGWPTVDAAALDRFHAYLKK